MKPTKKHIPAALRNIGLLLAVSFLTGGECGNSVYSEECRDLADALQVDIQSISEKYAACGIDDDCTYAAVVVPCNRDDVVNTVINPGEYDDFRQEIEDLSAAECTTGNIDDCNAHCGTGGSLLFRITGASCSQGKCIPATAKGDSSGSLPSSEICNPSKYGYLPADLNNQP